MLIARVAAPSARFHSLSLPAALLLLSSCYQLEIEGQVGCVQLKLDGDFGFASGSTKVDIGQDVTSAFRLGDDQGLPYDRVADMGVPAVTVSGFGFEEEGNGALTRNFGGSLLPIAGANVDSDPEPSSAKASLGFDIATGPVTISPGLAADYLDFRVSQWNGLASELGELAVPMPIGVSRAADDVGIVGRMAEAGHVAADIDEVTAKFIDLEAMLTVHATEVLDVWVGCRHLAIDADVQFDNDTFHADIKLDGIMLGGGVRF
jgi:hypothetical protein